MSSFDPISFIYGIIQWLINLILSPNPPPPHATLKRPRIAIIGTGLTGVSAASHCVGHGFDVKLFEANGPESVGGIWTRVNNTSSLQIHSIMFRFHPSVKWGKGYPDREQIVSQIKDLWHRYGLEKKTKFNCRVTSVRQDSKGRWIVNDPSNGRFDGVIAAVGTCGDPKIPELPGQSQFKGKIIHSSKLTGVDMKGKKIAVVGGGASAVEALEYAAHIDAAEVSILSRSDKWIIPRNVVVDTLLALNIFGQEVYLSWIPEALLRRFFYRDLKDIAPTSQEGLFTGTPMVNDEIFELIRAGKAKWLRGDIEKVQEDGIKFNLRGKGVPPGGPGKDINVDADFIIMATGFQRPSLSFLPDDVFEEPYGPPSWYLQTFPPQHVQICANNCTYVNAIGAVGNYHIGIYTRILLMFLIDPLTRPPNRWMKVWIDMTRFLKSRAPTKAFDFFTYSELIWWFFFCVVINPFRWKWALFVFFGVGIALPLDVLSVEDRVRNGLGMQTSEQLMGKDGYTI